MERAPLLALLLLLPSPARSLGARGRLDAAKIEQLTGLKGSLDESQGVFKVSYPRTDIRAKVAGARLTPPLGLTAWAAFTRAGKDDMVMGDLVLLEEQVNPVMSAALEHGLEVTALHNHFLGDSPRIMFMHIGGMGPEEKLAAAVGAVFAKIKETAAAKPAAPKAEIDPAKTTLDPSKIETILGAKGELKDGVYKVSFPKKTAMHGRVLGGAMGVNTWAAFAGSDAKAVVDGDFAMYEAELQGVLKALREAGIQVVAIHNHMTFESPRLVFLHFWGVGPTTELAQGIKAALDTQKK
ncbi:MAG TPA: DUF1259 domain-containing protein [Elusimicrobiota bacterium]|jgi:hypothetical protein|nr:DUF1259 domain-containing protein [Elusimicrobiota bacterium]